MVLNDFALLASDTARSKAYLQAMIQGDKLPGMCLVYADDIPKIKEEAGRYKEERYKEGRYKAGPPGGNYFDIGKPVLSCLEEAGIPYLLIGNKDINSGQMEDALKGLAQKYLIYSGYGGYLLKPHLFQLGKRFLHVHAGRLPQYRGSTTVYYSFLQEGILGATAIFLSKGIDEGEVIVRDTFGIPKEPVDMDYIYEPFIRSQVLLKALDKYLAEGVLTAECQSKEGAETYFIIHPVLKHLALLGMEKAWEDQA